MRRQPHVGNGTNRIEPASELRGEGDHLDAVADDFQQPLDIGVHQKFGVVGPATTLVEEWPFDVQSCQDPASTSGRSPTVCSASSSKGAEARLASRLVVPCPRWNRAALVAASGPSEKL